MIVNQNVKEIMLEGMKEMIEVVKKTLGPSGKNVVILGYDTKLSSDGLTVAKAITFEDNIKQVGRDLLVSGAELTKELAGDGTTSTMILTYELIKRIMECNDVNMCQIDEAVADIFNSLDSLGYDAKDEETLKQIAYTSSLNKQIATSVSQAVMKVGQYGYIGVVPTFNNEITFEEINGVMYDKGYVSHYLASSDKIILNNCYVILVDDNITKISELEGIIYDVKKIKKDLLLIANSYSKEVIDYIVYLKKNNTINICATLSPEFGNISSLYLSDLAIYLDTVIITSKTLYHTIDTIGFAEYVEVGKKNTLIRKNKLNEVALKKRIDYLIEDSKTSEESKKRLARLTSSIANIHIPCLKDYEYILLQEKARNAICAALNSYKGKAIDGGGQALLQITEVLSDKVKNTLRKVGYNSYVAIINSLSVIDDTIKSNKIKTNISNDDKPVDSLINMKIIISNAIYVLKMFLSIDSIVIKPKVEEINNSIF